MLLKFMRILTWQMKEIKNEPLFSVSDMYFDDEFKCL